MLNINRVLFGRRFSDGNRIRQYILVAMLTRNYYIIIFEGGGVFSATITPDPELVATYREREIRGEEVWVWDHPYPLWLGELIRDQILKQRRYDRRSLSEPNRTGRLGSLRKKIKREIRKWGYSGSGKWVRITGRSVDFGGRLPLHTGSEAAAAGEDLQKILPGRALTLKEIRRLLNKRGVNISFRELEALLQRYILDGSLKLSAGVGPDWSGRFTCRRCGATDRIIRSYAYDTPQSYWSCEGCRNMGAMTSATPLFRWVGLRPSLSPQNKVRLLLPDLTIWQKSAAQEAVTFWRNQENPTLLIWAVCGAGKTEIVFPLIHRALIEGKRVLLTVPRREVAAELGKRVEDSFPGLEFSLLYGGKKRESALSGLTVSTTHQLLRFFHQFDLAVLDEADAYPFNYEPMLAKALHRSLLPTGKLVYMTATPNNAWRKQARQGKIKLIRIPLRHHGYPLPSPVLKKAKLPVIRHESKCNIILPPEIIEELQRILSRGRRVLVFVPTVKLTERLGKYLKKVVFNYGGAVDYIHSSDPLREIKLQGFIDGGFNLMVTTTLLERGLTFPDLDVVILYADMKRVFSAETLVQIAGRVGRSANSPYGEVIMIGRSISPEMRTAKTWIEGMNREARDLGFLKKG